MAKYKRILLKLSGESLMGEKQYGIDEKRLAEYAAQIKEIHEQGVQIGIVIGGGNIFRGLSGLSITIPSSANFSVNMKHLHLIMLLLPWLVNLIGPLLLQGIQH